MVGRCGGKVAGVCADLSEAFPNCLVRPAGSSRDVGEVDAAFFAFSTLSWSPSVGFNDRQVEAIENFRIVRQLRQEFGRTKFGQICVISNPVDLLARYVSEQFGSGWVYGLGSTLDARRCRIAVERLWGKTVGELRCIGEHGAHLVPLLSEATDRDLPREEYESLRRAVFESAGQIIRNWAVPLFGPLRCCFEHLDAVFRDSDVQTTLSTMLTEELYGVCPGIALGVPVRLHRGSLGEVLHLDISEMEQGLFREAGEFVSSLYQQVLLQV